jgi:putative DNA primase/helicase
MIDFARINAAALGCFESLLCEWLPGGKRRGGEFICGDLSGNAGGSLSVNLRTGLWADFSGDARGGDPVSLLAAIRNCSQADAARELDAKLSAGGIQERRAPVAGPDGRPADAGDWQAEPFAPKGTPAPVPWHPGFGGAPSASWTYRTATGEIIGLVCRYNTEAGKEIIPFSWCRNAKTGETRWKFKSFAKPRPLYRLDVLAANPDAGVILVEGEKTADAAQRMLGDSVIVTTWPGGSKAVTQTDWTPLEGRRVIIWPDNDQPGRDAAEWVKRTHGQSFIVTPPPGKPVGWDLADAETEGWTGDTIRAWVAECKQAAAQPEPAQLPEPLHNQDYIPNEDTPPPSDAEVDLHVERAPEPEPDHIPPDESTPIPPPSIGGVELPFRILGHNQGTFFYLPRGSKQIVELSASEHKHLQLLQLAPDAWWNQIFASKDGPDWKAAANMLVQQSYDAGVFTPKRLRGRGAWLDGENIVLHVGDRLFVNGVPVAMSEFESRFIYEQGQPLEHSDAIPLTMPEAARLAELCDLLPWRHSIHGMLLTGWCVVAPICGVLAWRPHVWISGPSGSGKTWVVTNIIDPLVGKTALQVQSATTEAGIRQALRSDALPVVFDEAESEDKTGQGRMQRILELARQASSETGAGIIKGTAGGRAMEFSVRSCFVFASIGIAAVQRADTSRITPLELSKRNGESGAKAFADLKALWAETVGKPGFADGLRARALANARTIRANSKTLARAVAAKLGDQRIGDQLGALLAGAFAVTTDQQFTDEQAARRVDNLDWSPFLPDATDTDEVQALNVLMDSHIRVDDGRGSYTASVGELISQSQADVVDTVKDAAKATLLRHGIKVEDGWLTVSNSHHSLRRVFADTPWAGKWKDQLARVKGAEGRPATRFGPAKHRAVSIPLAECMA